MMGDNPVWDLELKIRTTKEEAIDFMRYAIKERAAEILKNGDLIFYQIVVIQGRSADKP
jgi:hypothetical protein